MHLPSIASTRPWVQPSALGGGGGGKEKRFIWLIVEGYNPYGRDVEAVEA